MLFRMFDLTSGNLSPVVNFEGISKNVMTVGFQVLPIIDTNWWNTISNKQAEGRWMFTGGEDCTARIWDLKMRNLSCQVYSTMDRRRFQLSSPQRIFQANAPVTCACLHPNQQEMVVGDQSGAIHIWNLQVRFCSCLMLVTSADYYRTTSLSRLFLTPKLLYNMWL